MKKSDHKKETLLGVKLPGNLIKKLKLESVKSGIKIKNIVEKALEEYLKK